MVDVRRILIIFVIGVLFAILSQAVIDAIYPAPKYEDFCKNSYSQGPLYAVGPGKVAPVNCTDVDYSTCYNQRGTPVNYTYNNLGCVVSYKCDFCQMAFDKNQQEYNLIVFLISSILGLIGIAIGLHLPSQSNSLNEWIATGFMLGGLLALFIGTARYYADMGRFIRPAVIFVELVIILYLAYKKLSQKEGPVKPNKTKTK